MLGPFMYVCLFLRTRCNNNILAMLKRVFLDTIASRIDICTNRANGQVCETASAGRGVQSLREGQCKAAPRMLGTGCYPLNMDAPKSTTRKPITRNLTTRADTTGGTLIQDRRNQVGSPLHAGKSQGRWIH